MRQCASYFETPGSFQIPLFRVLLGRSKRPVGLHPNTIIPGRDLLRTKASKDRCLQLGTYNWKRFLTFLPSPNLLLSKFCSLSFAWYFTTM